MSWNIGEDVRCPFYKYEKEKKIVCEGIVDKGNISLFFAVPKTKNEFRCRYCETDFDQCLLYNALMKKYD